MFFYYLAEKGGHVSSACLCENAFSFSLRRPVSARMRTTAPSHDSSLVTISQKGKAFLTFQLKYKALLWHIAAVLVLKDQLQGEEMKLRWHFLPNSHHSGLYIWDSQRKPKVIASLVTKLAHGEGQSFVSALRVFFICVAPVRLPPSCSSSSLEV